MIGQTTDKQRLQLYIHKSHSKLDRIEGRMYSTLLVQLYNLRPNIQNLSGGLNLSRGLNMVGYT